MTLKHRVLQLIAARPDLTEAEIAKHLPAAPDISSGLTLFAGS